MKKLFLTKSIKKHIIIYFSLIFLLSIGLFGFMAYNFFSNILINEILNYTTKLADETRVNLDSYFGQINALLQITASNSLVVEGVREENLEDITVKFENSKKINELLQDILKLNSNIKDIILIDSRGFACESTAKSVLEDYDFVNKGWFPREYSQFFKATFVGLHAQDYYLVPEDNEDEVVSAVIPIMDFINPQDKSHASIMCNLKVEEIHEITKETTLEKTGFFLIVDNNSQIIYQPHNYHLSESQKDKLIEKMTGESGNFIVENEDKKMMMVYKTSKVTGWKVVALIPMKEILSHLEGIKKITLILTFICIITVFFVSVLISGRVTKPITRLMKRMGRIEQGNFDVKLYDDSTEEIEMLSSRMDLMIERINSLNRDIYLYQIRSREAMIKALQTQINPHFLYNTLQAIKAMAVCGKNPEIGKIVTLLGNMLRYAVYNSEELVNISDEMNHVKVYLEIQNFRYPAQYTYETEIEEGLDELKTLKLILQPIVENSIIHGLSGRKKGTVRIKAGKNPLGIQFSITDDGKGISGEELSGILEYVRDPAKKEESHSIGLKNVHERVRLKFGDPYGIDIVSNENEGTCVKVLIPEVI